jgi:hypothetical protein
VRRAFFFLAVVASLAAFADDPPPPSVQGLTAVERGGQVSVRFHLTGAFRDGETVESLQSGLPTTITYYVELFRDRPNWIDDGIRTVRLEAICTYNSITREYLLNYRRDRHLVRSETFTDLAALERAMTTIEEPDLFDVSRRKPWKLKVRARASLARGWVLWVIPWDNGSRWAETRIRSAEPPR